MKVILLQNIKNFGRIGDIKSVSDGYARNFLLPHGKAKIATESGIKEAETLKARSESEIKIKDDEALKISDKLKDLNLEFPRKLSATGTLFAALTAKEIAKELSLKAGIKIEADMVDLEAFENHIKHSGSHIVPIRLSDKITAQINIVVTEKK